ncbi:hypothetical protein JXD38_10880, partial [candidate division WOR-3 bacterium]|nr:hypothetical protein [candidate division WOR-3 bacterium]
MTAIRRTPVLVLALLLFNGCTYAPIPRPTYIRPGFAPEAGAGGAVLYSDEYGTEPAGQGSVLLGLNPTNWLGFDLGVHGG